MMSCHRSASEQPIQDVLAVPEEAVILEKDKKFALLVTAENMVEKKEIVTGRRSLGFGSTFLPLTDNQ